MQIFKILLGEALAALSAEELSEYRDELRATAERVYAKDAETIGELSPSELLEQMQAAVAAIGAANERLAELSAADETPEEPADFDSEIEALATQARGEDTEPETPEEPETPAEPEAIEPEPVIAAADDEPEPEEPTEPEEPEEPEATVAAAEPAKPAPARLPARSTRHTPTDTAKPKTTLTASCEGIGYAIGEAIPDEQALAAAMIAKRFNFGHMTAKEKVPVGRYDWSDEYPESRHLSPVDTINATTAKIKAVVAAIEADPKRGTGEALIASGGICAPVTPYYPLDMVSTTDRPVRGSLPAFLADRGGIRAAAPPTLADVDTAIGIITAEEDAAGGSSATKTCQVIECPEFSEFNVDILFHCLQTSNLTSRTYPEQLAQFTQLVMAAFARMAEVNLLDKMSAASKQVTASDSGLGAVGNLLPQVLTAAAGVRSRNRMSPDATLRAIFPRWASALMVSDVVRSQFQRFDTDEARITALLRSYGIEPTFTLDGVTGASQIYGSQSDGALLPFPATVGWFLFPEGSFLYLDGGTLELGLVRDSVLNATNEFQVFGESFETVAFLGVESMYVTSTVCDSGAAAQTESASACGNWNGD